MTPRGIRNNNPGNLRAVAGIAWRGQIGADDKGFCIFDTAHNGLRANAKQLIAYQDKHGIRTVRGAINRWAPPSENDTGAYVNAVCAAVGVGPDDQIDMHRVTTLVPLLMAIVQHENGQQPYSTNEIGAAVADALAIEQSVPATSPAPQPKPEPTPPPAAPPPPQPPKEDRTMGAAFISAFLPTIFELFSGRAAAAVQKISGAPQETSAAFVKSMAKKVEDLSGIEVTDNATAFKAAAAVVDDPTKLQELQDHALDYLEKVAPFLDKLAGYEQAEWNASEASVKAAAARNVESKDIPLFQDRAFIVSAFILLMVAMVVFSVLWKDAIVAKLGLKDIGGFSTDMQSFVIGAIVGSALTAVIAYFLGTNRQSAAKDATIQTLSRATRA